MYVRLSHSTVYPKPSQHCQSAVFQYKTNSEKKLKPYKISKKKKKKESSFHHSYTCTIDLATDLDVGNIKEVEISDVSKFSHLCY